MPNWKSYDSSVRLLSAILAAHPELKLNYQEIAECFGDKATGSSMRFRFRRIKDDAKAIKEARAKGVDPMTLDMDGGLCKEISRRYGGDCTISALENRFRRVKADAKALNDALARGIDPMTIPTDSLNGKTGKGKKRAEKPEIAKYYGDCTASSLDHRFRPIKKEAHAMRDGIADKYGEDTTAKAVSTRFERMKKEPGWLTNNAAGSNGGSNGTAKAKPATPRKPKNGAGAGGNNNSDDEESFDGPKHTPSKGNLNKTKTGRIAKPKTPSKNSSFTAAHIDFDDDDEDSIIKTETNGTSNGYDHSHGHSHSNGYANGNGPMDVDHDDENDQFVEANENAYVYAYADEGDEA